MHPELLALLADPATGRPLELVESSPGSANDVAEGILESPDGGSFAIHAGIPRFVEIEDDDQAQTARSFGFKWENTGSYEDPAVQRELGDWFLSRYGFADAEEMAAYMSARRRILDAGCGSGLSASFWLSPSWRGDSDVEYVGLDISAAIDVARQRLADIPSTSFVQGDALHPPFLEGTFDVVLSEGVMHHTPSTSDTFSALARLLAPGGEFMFYVYRRKAPIRELTDDYLRSVLAPLPPDEAWEALRPLTSLAKVLSDAKVEIDIPEDVPILGIEAGRHDVQRLLYWHFAKLFWNEALPFETNLHVNFDWYHPRYAHRHTEEEIRGWCAREGLTIVHFDAAESGYTVRAVKE